MTRSPEPIENDLSRPASVVSSAELEPECGSEARDCLVLAAIDLYRSDPPRYSAHLLELLQPSISRRLPFLPAQFPVIGPHDVHQQLVLEVLRAAAEMRFVSPRFVDRVLVRRAARQVARWLEAESDECERLESLDESDGEADEDDL